MLHVTNNLHKIHNERYLTFSLPRLFALGELTGFPVRMFL